MRRVSVPGKVMLAGEYAVLLPGSPCLVAAVERRLTVEAEPAAQWEVRTGDLRWIEGAPVPAEFSFVVATIGVLRDRFALSPRRLTTSDDLKAGELKLGLGGSAAVTVATVWALAPEGSRTDELWAVADEIHRKQQGGHGSGADVAASAHGGVLRYVSDPRSATALAVHPDVRLLLVWTGKSAQTAPRLLRFAELSRARPTEVQVFTAISGEAVRTLQAGLVTGNLDLIRGGIGQARTALRGLEAIANLEIETTPLRLAADVAWEAGAAGKLSGAGGGDCAVVLALGDPMAARVTAELERAGLQVIATDLARGGPLSVRS